MKAFSSFLPGRFFVFFLLGPLAHCAEVPALRWVDGSSLLVEGRGWTDTRGSFGRLPARAEGVVRGPVFSLGRDAAGVTLRFVSDTPSLRVRWRLGRSQIAMNHFAATGVSGVDLYARIDGEWRWIAVGRPDKMENEAVLFENVTHGSSEFLLYLPLYNIVEKLELGLAPDARLTAAERDVTPPIVFYGTSAVQGGCASRPGMAYPAIIGRRLHCPTINLGFSGNGKAEPEVAALLAELDPAAYVIDCLPNLEPAEAGRVDAFVAILRKARPTTPILLVENLAYPDGLFVPARRERHLASNLALHEIYTRRRAGDPDLHYLKSDRLLGEDNDATVDGSHPTDLGFSRMADEMTPLLRKMLAASRRP